MRSVAVAVITICTISTAWAQIPLPYFERPDMVTTNTRCIGIRSSFLFPFEHVHGRQHFEQTLMAKIRLSNVHQGTMLRIDAKGAAKFMPSTMADKKCF
uniref:Reelin domain-containing protein n=1 Tax=Elaeophora elaphi TaxID=1147741 RepID=A0A0R3S614_9BILA